MQAALLLNLIDAFNGFDKSAGVTLSAPGT
jgi:hypothetical protein